MSLDTENVKSVQGSALRVLAIDVGGSHVKIRVNTSDDERVSDSGPKLTPAEMVKKVQKIAEGLQFDAVTIGYPGPVLHNRILAEPFNLGTGWTSFDFTKTFDAPLRIVNDAMMQAIGSYHGGRMLFLGLGTGLGAALVVDNVCMPLEVGHMPYRKGRSFEDYLSEASLQKRGHKKWRNHVFSVVKLLDLAFRPDYIVIGGGNVDRLDKLPPKAVRGNNSNAFAGGFRIWSDTRLVL
ncbi:MAG: ROK family protein [Paracoccaceae bacterium]